MIPGFCKLRFYENLIRAAAQYFKLTLLGTKNKTIEKLGTKGSLLGLQQSLLKETRKTFHRFLSETSVPYGLDINLNIEKVFKTDRFAFFWGKTYHKIAC